MKLYVGTNVIFEDEPCLKLWEADMQSDDSSGFHRYRFYKIIRGGNPMEFREDCGLTENYKGTEPLVMWTGIVDGGVFYGHNVGEARVMADQYRNHIRFDTKDLVGVNNVILR